MFKREKQDLIIPQREHARLAGNIATHWGNEKFDLPKIPIHSVVKGIAFHQDGYPLFDAYPIKEMDEDTLVEVYKKDFNVALSDTEAELINMFHQYRLVSARAASKATEKFRKLEKEFEEAIKNKLRATKYNKDDFLWADRITNVCDRISFNFSFGVETTESISVYPKVDSVEKIEMTHVLKDEKTMYLDPWPFSSSQIKNIVMAYKNQGYPGILTPVLLEFRLIKSTT